MKVWKLIRELAGCNPEAEIWLYFFDEVDGGLIDLLITGVADRDEEEVILDYGEEKRNYWEDEDEDE